MGGSVTEADLTVDLKAQLQEVLGDRYRIERELAGGGMSRVFVAEEVELERKVVVKVLPPDLAAGLNIDRFRREITLAAKLQHPHIVPLLAGGAHGALLYYTMPFIEGESLREKLAKSRELPVHDAVKILIEIADALAYAHSHSVVHRDIKPENVLMTGKHAVVTDFGVARALSNSTGATSLTSMGVALGTPAYMAPEQAAADPLVDHRADIYALGVVGYELLTGRTPFAGLTPQMMLSAQVTTAPDQVTKYRQNVPPQLAAVIMQCLEKNPADRLQSADEVRARLEAMSTPSGGMEPVTGFSPARRPAAFQLTPQRIGVIAAALGLLGAGLFAASTAFRGSEDAFVIGATKQITSAAGLELFPAISPDGNTVAFASGVPGKMSLYIRQVGGGRVVRLTDEQEGNVAWPLWSPDGTRIAYLNQGRGRILTVPALGGRASVLIPERPVTVTNGGWSPDGKLFAYSQADTIYVADADGTNARVVTDKIPLPHAISWSPDGSRLAVASGDRRFLFGGGGQLGNVAASAIWVANVAGDSPTQLTDQTLLRTSPIWSADGSHILYVSSAGGIRDIYRQRIASNGKPEGVAERLTTGLNPHSISLSRDGTLLSYSQLLMTSNVFSLPLTTRGAMGDATPRQVTSGNHIVEALAVSPDGQWLAFDSNLAGNQDIYKVPIAGGEMEQLTRDPADDFQPAWSPDGNELTFHSFRNGDRDLFSVSADGGSTNELVRGPGEQLAATWSPVADRVAFVTQEKGAGFLALVERSGGPGSRWGTPRRLAESTPFSTQRWSPDGRFIVFQGRAGLAVIDPAGGPPRRLITPAPGRPVAGAPVWSKDSRTIYFLTQPQGSNSAVWAVPREGGEPERIISFTHPARQLFRGIFDVDDKNFYVTIGSRESDIWVMELPRKK